MRIPITKDGVSVLATMTLALVVVGALATLWTLWVWLPLGLVWLWGLSFFRDPERQVQRSPCVLYAPADGKVTEVAELQDHELLGCSCVRIRIFLSLFNVHINRMPCAAKVVAAEHKAGKFINALKPESAELNESNALLLEPASPISGPLVVRQIAGMVARTIVCHAVKGDELGSGQRFGMIKFGSGTELVIPHQPGLTVLARVGDKVRGGLSQLARIEEPQADGRDRQDK